MSIRPTLRLRMSTLIRSLTTLSITLTGKSTLRELKTSGLVLKRSLSGTYIAVEPFHLFRYVDEQMFRYNNRATRDNPLTDADRFQYALSQIVGKRLTFAEVTGKVGETAF